MIKITVELISANTGEISKLGEMHISNTGNHIDNKYDYTGRVLKKPRFNVIVREGHVDKHDRGNKTIWHLICKMLNNMGYET